VRVPLTVKQPRYLGLAGLCLVIATICALAGTWQAARLRQKHTANQLLRSNDRAAAVDIATVLGPAAAPTASGALAKFRHITATGSFIAAGQTLWRGQTVDNATGYVVLTPLRTDNGIVVVARGFIQQNNAADTSPAVIPAPPGGTVKIAGRLLAAEAGPDRFGSLPGVQIDTVNAAQQAARLASPVWGSYAQLEPGQPGSAGLTAFPDPDMSNPAGGAEELQHFAYIVQWYVFAALALGAPFLLIAADRRRDDAAAGHAAPAKPSLDDRLAGRT